MIMGNIRHRLMEGVILLVVLINVLPLLVPRLKQGEYGDLSKELILSLNQGIWDRYGPGEWKAYRRLFSGTQDFNPDPLFRPVAASTMEGADLLALSSQLAAVKGAPEWYHKTLDETRPFFDELNKALDLGPMMFAPSDIEFASPAFITPNFLRMQLTAKCLASLAGKEWAQSDPAGAVEQLNTGERLAEALRHRPLVIDQLIRIAVHGIMLNGYDVLLWQDPDAESNRIFLNAVEGLRAAEWNYESLDGEPIVMMAQVLGPAQMPGGGDMAYMDPEFAYACSLLLQSAGMQRGPMHPLPPEMIRVSGELHSEAEVILKAVQWTTLPAMRRRLRQLPEETYQEQDNVLLSEDLKKRIPPLLLAPLRFDWLDMNSRSTSIETRLLVVKERCAALKTAWRARVWRDEHGAWPDAVAFQSLTRDATSVAWHVVADPTPLTERLFEQIDGGRTRYFDTVDINIVGSATALMTLKVPRFVLRQFNYLPDDLELNTANVATWRAGILRAHPLVESVTATQVNTAKTDERKKYTEMLKAREDLIEKGRLLTAQMMQTQGFTLPPGWPAVEQEPFEDYQIKARVRLPARSYWATMPGPDGVADGPGLSYDPTNGTVSAGDIVQLAGWE